MPPAAPIHLPGSSQPAPRANAAAHASMSGAACLAAVLAAGGIEACFANPGTTELHLLAALTRQAGIRCTLGLFEGVVTGAADGYARMARKPAATLLHLGPGLANGLANLHNARRARVPVINLVGDHPASHLLLDPPLAADIEAIARPYSDWQRTAGTVASVGADAAAAIQAACAPPGGIATLIVPAGVAWGTGAAVPIQMAAPVRPPLVPPERIRHAVERLRQNTPAALVLGGEALFGSGLAAAGCIAQGCGAALLTPYPLARLARGGNLPLVERIPYPPEQARARLQAFRHLILIGCARPTGYFARPGESAELIAPECEVFTAALPEEDCAAALESIAEQFPRPARATAAQQSAPAHPCGHISLEGIAAALAAVLPPDAIVVDESMTSGRQFMAATKICPPHDWLANTGGSIGIALPLAVGAAVACPGRRVLCLSAEGSGMYTAQALWTMAHEALNITVLILNNRRYGVLQSEWRQLGLGDPSRDAAGLLDLSRPVLDWTLLARGMGVPGDHAESLEQLADLLRCGLGSAGPRLVEVLV